VAVAQPAFAYTAPNPISSAHNLENFDCGKSALNDWLRTHALENEGKASRTFVVADGDGAVVGYYCLATGSVARAEVPRRIRHGLPNPTPVMVLGRLAVDRHHASRGIASMLLKEAMIRTLRVAREAGIRALVVHAIDDEAVTFYTKYGFQIFPPETRTLLLPVETIELAIS
jgi:GNAT superfamily N-acetyltransferase